ncbi:MAG: TerC family protein [Rhizobiales bacterium]|nr:TerC family protein [Hyphomicrobiales bacterium]
MFEEMFSASVLTALFQVIMIDLVLAGDNAVVIGLAAAGLPKEQRGKVIVIGIVAATVLRIVLALMTTQLLQVVGLLLAGGILLLWVSWKMWRELRSGHGEEVEEAHVEATADNGAPRKSFRAAVWQIIVADFSMSLDNVLAVGGAAREHPWVLVFGLALSIALMGLAATWIASLLQRYRWIGYAGLAIIVYVAFEMVWRGWTEVSPVAARVVSPDFAAMVPFVAAGLLGLVAIVGFANFYRRRHTAS